MQTKKGATMTKLNVHQRINKVMNELPYLKKTSTVGYGNNSYTAITHDHVTQSLHPLCVKYGIVMQASMVESSIERYQVVTRKGDTVDRYETKTTAKVKVVNIDSPDDSFEVQATAHGFDSQDKSPGKAYSMAVKYCYLKTFMIASGDDEEERIDTAIAINKESERLKEELTRLLKAKNKFNDIAITYMNQLDINGLLEAIERNKES